MKRPTPKKRRSRPQSRRRTRSRKNSPESRVDQSRLGLLTFPGLRTRHSVLISMAKKRQLVLTRPPIAKGDPTVTPLGTRKDLLAALAVYNTSPDGSKRNTGMEI